MTVRFLQNVWYMAGWEHELAAGVVARTIAEVPVVVARHADGRVFALHDQCPHRFAPLSRGRVNELGLECGYHGVTFAADGQCVANPLGNGVIPAACHVRSYPVVVQDRIIWVWLGDPQQASRDRIARMPCFADPDARFAFGVTAVKANYELITDNLLDLTHAVYIHPAFGGPENRPKVSMERVGATIYSRYVSEDVPNAPFAEAVFPTHGKHVDTWDDIRWNAPGVHYLESGTKVTGTAREAGMMVPAVHIVTPATASTTTYFWCSGLPAGYPGTTEQFHQDLCAIFEQEDLPMIEAVQQRMQGQEFWSLKPVLLKNDGAAVSARRLLAEMIAAEQSG